MLDQQDHNGDTAILLAAKFGARKCVRALAAFGASVDIPNSQGDTAGNLIRELNARRRDRYRQGSSSPLQVPNGSSNSQGPASQNSQSFLLSKNTHWISEAATLVSTQLPALIASRTEALAAAIEKELMDREHEAKDSEVLLKHRREEISLICNSARELSGELERGLDDPERTLELEGLMTECRKIAEAEQMHEIQRFVEAGVREAPDSKAGTAMAGRSLDDSVAAAHQLHEAQLGHSELVTDLTAAQSVVSSGRDQNRQDVYKRLITGALGVEAEDVEAMLPDMLVELEEARGDAIAAVAMASPSRPIDADEDLSMVNAPVAKMARTSSGYYGRHDTGRAEVGVMG